MMPFRFTWDNVQAVELNWLVTSVAGVALGGVVIVLAVQQVLKARRLGINGDVRFLGSVTVLAESLRVFAQVLFAVLGVSSMREPAGPPMPDGLPWTSTARLIVPVLFAVQWVLIAKSALALYVRLRLRD